MRFSTLELATLLSLAAGAATSAIACGGSDAATMSNDAGASPGDDGSSTGHDAATGDDGGAPSIATACADQAKARCQRGDACSNGTWVTQHYGDEATCETRLTLACTINASAPSTGATATTVEACAQAIAGLACADFFGNQPAAACLPPVGGLANGASCIASAQCQSTYCAIPEGASCGSCAGAPKVGDACTIATDCGSRGGMTCAPDGLCVVQGQASAACDKNIPCAPGFSCVGAKAIKKGTCEPAVVDAGAPCDPSRADAASCEGNLDLACATTTDTCVTGTFAGGGSPCGYSGDALVRCSGGGQCVASDGGANDAGAVITGSCKSAAMEGSACDLAAGPPCLAPARCVVTTDGGRSGSCALPDSTVCH